MVLLAETCAGLGDKARAATLHKLLTPYADRCVVTGANAATWGSAARHLGLLASQLERWDEAQNHFEDALQRNAEMGMRPWLADTQIDYANMLVTRDHPGDRARAEVLLQDALNTAIEIGMTGAIDQIAALRRIASLAPHLRRPRANGVPG